MTRVTDTIALDDHDIQERFVRAMGSRAQNALREATAVELRLDLAHCSLPDALKERLVILGGRRVTNEGVLVIVSRANRSQIENRETARTRLIELVRSAAESSAPRKTTKPRRAVRANRLDEKRRHSVLKRGRAGRDDD
jgi:ribosome-associated protein